jgi:hypothetical protein
LVCVAVLHRYLPPGQKLCKVFEAETFGLDFGVRFPSELKSPARAGLQVSSDLSLSAVSMVSNALVVIGSELLTNREQSDEMRV